MILISCTQSAKEAQTYTSPGFEAQNLCCDKVIKVQMQALPLSRESWVSLEDRRNDIHKYRKT